MIYLRKSLDVLYFGILAVLVLAGCASAPEERPATDEDRAFLASYLEKFKVEAFFNKASAEESLFKEAVTGSARKILAKAGRLAEKTGEAEVLVEIDAVSEGESRGENHYGTASVRCTIVEPFTASRLELAARAAPRTFSKASQFDAAANAATAALERMLPDAIEQARLFLVDLYSKGIVYGLEASNMGKDAASFRKKFAAKARDFKVVEETREKAIYRFAFFGLPEDAGAALKEAAAEAGIQGFTIQDHKGKLLRCNGGN